MFTERRWCSLKRLAAVLIICVLLLGVFPASASDNPADPSAEKAADILYELGLFRGTGTDASGKPIYDLDAVPTRGQAIVMLVRLLGAERAALDGEWRHPFDDVSEWAVPYVGYAYENGLTNGISATAFGTNETALPIMYMTFVLRALGYRDIGENADFSYSGAVAFAGSIGLADKDYAEGFLRGDLAVVSLNALGLHMKGSDTTLIRTLVDRGAVDAQTAYDAGFSVTPPEPDIVLLPAKWDYSDPALANQFYAEISATAIKAAFPEAAGMLRAWVISADPGIYYSNKYSYKEMLFLTALGSIYSISSPGYPTLTSGAVEKLWNFYNGCAYIIDSNYNILGVCYAVGQTSANGDVKIIRGGEGVDGAMLYRTVSARLDEALINYDSAELTIAHEGYDSLDDGTGAACTYPAYLDGIPLGKDNYVLALSIAPWVIDESGFSAYNYTRKWMYDVLFMSDGSLRFENGTVENFYFSEFGSRQAYSPAPESPDNFYGIRMKESRGSYTFIIVFDSNGTVLGSTLLPPT